MNEKSHWDRVYTTVSAQDVSWFQAHAGHSLNLVRKIADGRHRHVIDVGVGASTLVDDLLELGAFDVSVLDISAAALEVARKRVGLLGHRAHWLLGDIPLDRRRLRGLAVCVGKGRSRAGEIRLRHIGGEACGQ